MGDSVQLSIELTDRVSGPARKIERALGRTESAAKSFNRANQTFENARGTAGASGFGGSTGGGLLGGAAGIGAALGAGLGLVGMLQGAARAAFDLAMALGRVGFEAAVAFGKAVSGAAMFRESSVLAFKSLSKGASDGVAEFEKVKALALEFGAPLKETVDQFAAMQRMGFKMPEIERMFKRFQDLKTIGVGADQIGRAVLAITQIKATGKLQGDELMQLAEAGVSIDEVYKALGKRLGKTVPEIIKLKEAGKITAVDAIASIEDAMGTMAGGKPPGALGKNFATNYITGLMERFKNLGPILQDDIASRLAPAMEALKPILDDIFKAFSSPAIGKVFDAIAGVINGIVATVKAAWPVIKAFTSGIGEGFSKGFDAAMRGWREFEKASGSDSQEAMMNLATVARAAGMAIGLMAGSLAALAVGLANAEKAAQSAFAPLDKINTIQRGLGLGEKGVGEGLFGIFGKGGIPTGSSMFGTSLTADTDAAAGGPKSVTNQNSLNVAVSGVGKNDQELAVIIRREAERIFLQKLGGASPI